jgi:hypothetical protein
MRFWKALEAWARAVTPIRPLTLLSLRGAPWVKLRLA